MHILAVSLEPFVVVGAGKRDISSVRVARQEDACFLEQLARGRHVIGDRVLRGQPLELPSGVIDSIAPADAAVVIGCIHASAGKHMGTAHEWCALMAANEEHLRASRAVAQHHHRCRRTGIGDKGIRRHNGQY